MVAQAQSKKGRTLSSLPLTFLKTLLLILICLLAFDVGSDFLVPGISPPDLEAAIPVEYDYSDVHIETVDGYQLTVYHIYHKQYLNDSLPPIILQHGYGGYGFSWFIHTETDAVPLVLAKLGYRVFVINGRGTSASLAHKHLSYHQPEYWDFTLEDLPKDVLALLDYLKEQKFPKPVYIGHSQGATQMIAGLGDSRFRKQLETSVLKSYLLAPVWCATDHNALILKLSSRMTATDTFAFNILRLHRVGNLFPSANAVQNWKEQLLNNVCSAFPKACFWAFSGTDKSNEFNDLSNYGTWNKHHLASVSVKAAYHFSQFARDAFDGTCDMGRYDYGTEKNLQVYGSERSPRYNFTDISHPVNIYFGDQDKYYGPEDVNRVRNLFKGKSNVKILDHYTGWGHMSFTQGTKTREFYTNDIHKDIQAALKSTAA